MKKQLNASPFSRRQFVKNTGVLAGSLLAAPLISHAGFFAGGDDTIKIALIGCGSREQEQLSRL
jgi:hypothetical protein